MSSKLCDRGSGWIQTYTGKRFWPLDPRPEDVDIRDIAHALSLNCRFTGHVKKHYSVAQHSVLVSRYCSRETALWGLLHDASEAYLMDLARPVKQEMRRLGVTVFDDAERRIMWCVCEKFGLPIEEPAEVKQVDTKLLVTEARDLMSSTEGWEHTEANGYDAIPSPLFAWASEEAEKAFLSRFDHLTKNPGVYAGVAG